LKLSLAHSILYLMLLSGWFRSTS